MKLVRGAWKLLVGIKDALVLVAMLLFFVLLFAAINSRPTPTTIKDGALVLDLNGAIVEQPEEVPPFAFLTGNEVGRQYRLRDVIRALDDARSDSRVKAVVLDLDRFGGAYPATLGEVADALGRVRASGKPVLAYATAYTDGGYRLAAAASELWMDPMGGTLFAGPGGNRLYYKGLIDRLGVNAHIYRVGKYKSFVEPYTRSDESPESREASTALYGTLFEQWREAIARARPKAKIADWLTAPDRVVAGAGGDIAQANLASGLVDKLGDRVAFGRRVAEIAGGGETSKRAGSFAEIDYDAWLDAHPLPGTGAIGVVTVAGDIVDGKADPGTAGGETIANHIYEGLAKNDLKALVVRVDSPGGSVIGSEKVRLAILEAKKRGLPVVISMGGLAASGGYWISTAGDVIFAEPGTITGSIGIFGILPTFENTLAKIGVTSDGVKTTPLTAQPDLAGGTNAATDAVLQSAIENGYAQFIARVAQARKMPAARVNEIAQGRVWVGGIARQIGLVDRFGTLNDAVAEAAKRAKLDPATVKIAWLEKKPGWADRIAKQIAQREEQEDEGSTPDAFGLIALRQRDVLTQALGDVRRLLASGGVQARCLECGALGPVRRSGGDVRLLDALLAKIGL